MGRRKESRGGAKEKGWEGEKREGAMEKVRLRGKK
jgi:hypothetical protein